MKRLPIMPTVVVIILFALIWNAKCHNDNIYKRAFVVRVNNVEFEKWRQNIKPIHNEEIRQAKKKYQEIDVIVTAYDLSVESCGKTKRSKEYGITKTGRNLQGHTWRTARAISVDPKVVPLGSKIKIEFKDEKYKKYNGEYTAVDTGSAIKKNKIDFFLGDFNSEKPSQECFDFGVTKAKLIIKGV